MGTPLASTLKRSCCLPCGRFEWGPRVPQHTEVRQDAPHDPGIVDGRDDSHPTSAVRTGENVHGKDALEQVGPAPARRAQHWRGVTWRRLWSGRGRRRGPGRRRRRRAQRRGGRHRRSCSDGGQQDRSGRCASSARRVVMRSVGRRGPAIGDGTGAPAGMRCEDAVVEQHVDARQRRHRGQALEQGERLEAQARPPAGRWRRRPRPAQLRPTMTEQAQADLRGEPSSAQEVRTRSRTIAETPRCGRERAGSSRAGRSHTRRAWPAQYGSRSWRFSTLPFGSRGSSATNSTLRGVL